MAEEFARRGLPALVLTGRCRPFGQRRPLDALGEALSAQILGTGPHDVDALQGGAQTDRRPYRRSHRTSWCCERPRHPPRGLKCPRGRRPDAIESVVRAARGIVEDLAKDGPVLFILDDLHWAHPDLLDAAPGTRTPRRGRARSSRSVRQAEGVDPVFPRARSQRPRRGRFAGARGGRAGIRSRRRSHPGVGRPFGAAIRSSSKRASACWWTRGRSWRRAAAGTSGAPMSSNPCCL